MEKTEKLVYKPGVTLEGIYKAYSPRFGFLITDLLRLPVRSPIGMVIKDVRK